MHLALVRLARRLRRPERASTARPGRPCVDVVITARFPPPASSSRVRAPSSRLASRFSRARDFSSRIQPQKHPSLLFNTRTNRVVRVSIASVAPPPQSSPRTSTSATRARRSRDEPRALAFVRAPERCARENTRARGRETRKSRRLRARRPSRAFERSLDVDGKPRRADARRREGNAREGKR